MFDKVYQIKVFEKHKKFNCAKNICYHDTAP